SRLYAGTVVVPGVLPRFCHQGSDVPVPHVAAGRARRSSHRGLGNPGRRALEDGNVRVRTVFTAVLPKCSHASQGALLAGGAFNYRHHLWRTGFTDAERYEEARGVLVGQPPRVLYAWHLRAEPGRTEWIDHPADQPRYFYRRTLPDCRHSL